MKNIDYNYFPFGDIPSDPVEKMEKKQKIQKRLKKSLRKKKIKKILKLRKKWRSNIRFKAFEKRFWYKYTLVL